jgi:hypothetical protein
MTDLHLITDLRPDVPLPHPEELAAPRARLTAAIAAEHASTAEPIRIRPALLRRRRINAAVIGGVASVAAAATVMALLPGRAATGLISTEEQPLGSMTSQAARPVLLAMAASTTQAPAGTGRFWCQERIEGRLIPIGSGGRELTPPRQGERPSPASGYRYSIFSRSATVSCETPDGRYYGTELSQDLGARPATPGDDAAWRRAGSPSRWQTWYDYHVYEHLHPGSPQRVGRGGISDPMPWGDERSLPADPVKLAALMVAGIGGPSDKGVKSLLEGANLTYRQWRIETLFSNLIMLLNEPVTPEVRAAALRALAAVPGVRVRRGVRDPIGRVGTAVWIGSPYDGAYIIDPATARLIALDEVAGKSSRVYEPGTMTGYQLWLKPGWTSHLPRSLPRATPSGPSLGGTAPRPAD